MTKLHKELIKERFENAVHEYCIAFCKKHEYDYDPDGWVGGDVGGVLEVVDGYMYVDFDEIRLDIDKDVPKGTFEEYYDYTTEVGFVDGARNMNYRSWCMGYRPYTAEQLKELHEAQVNVRKAEQILRELVEQYKREGC